jgi:hypothetical protein
MIAAILILQLYFFQDFLRDGVVEYTWVRQSWDAATKKWAYSDEGKSKLVVHGQDWRIARESHLAPGKTGGNPKIVLTESRSLNNTAVSFYRRGKEPVLGEAWVESSSELNSDRRWGCASLMFGRLPDPAATSFVDVFPDMASIAFRGANRWESPYGTLTVTAPSDNSGWTSLDLERNSESREYLSRNGSGTGKTLRQTGLLSYRLHAEAKRKPNSKAIPAPYELSVDVKAEVAEEDLPSKYREVIVITHIRNVDPSRDFLIEMADTSGVSVIARDQPGLEYVWVNGELTKVGPTNLKPIVDVSIAGFRKRTGGMGWPAWIGVGSALVLAAGAALALKRRRES